MWQIILIICLLFFLFYLHQPKFGRYPHGKRLVKIQQSPHYQNGQFRNIAYSAPEYGKSSPLKAFNQMIRNQRPEIRIPSTYTDLMHLDPSENISVWFGHSSYFIQIDGVKILVDPVLSQISSPIPFFPKAFSGTNRYQMQDIPNIDILIITHDHWDHLDYKTVIELHFDTVICPLGVGSHFERWGFNHMIEMDWNDVINLHNQLQIFCLPSKHFSGRSFLRNKTLWASFMLQTSSDFKIFIGGDGGYDSRFCDFQTKFGYVDIAILENGQYSESWPDIHMHPQETLMAAANLHAKALFPVHNSKFQLAPHRWNDPLMQLSKYHKNYNFRLLTPRIGEKVELDNPNQVFSEWLNFIT